MDYVKWMEDRTLSEGIYDSADKLIREKTGLPRNDCTMKSW
jgi:hypothetical protein